jgi:small GTP-binding protein
LSNTINLKLGVYGEGAVGKTSLINVFLGKEVPTEYSPTLNSEVSKKEYILKKADVIFKLNIWDVGGNRAVNPIINKAFFSEVDLALIVFDLTRTDLTLKSYQKNFLDKINQYSEEPLTLMVGNKLDKLLLNNDFKKAIQNYLGEKKSFSISSATSELNVNICFELLIYTFLKKSEILLPDLVPENSSSEFIELIGKTEEELREQLVNLTSIGLKHQDLKPKIKKADVPSQEEDKEKKYHEFILQELQKISLQKNIFSEKFLEIITKTEEELNQFKKINIKSNPELVDKLIKSIELSKGNCEKNLEALIRLKREENELLIINSKNKEDKLKELQKIEPVTQKTKKIISEPQLPEINKKSKPKPKPLEVKVKVKPKPLKVKTKPKPKPLEVKVKAKPKPSNLKLKTVKITSKPIKKDPKVELHIQYEKINPGKRAIFRGKETKGFLEWKNKQKS